jgi:hypothetical protein
VTTGRDAPKPFGYKVRAVVTAVDAVPVRGATLPTPALARGRVDVVAFGATAAVVAAVILSLLPRLADHHRDFGDGRIVPVVSKCVAPNLLIA